MQETKDNILAIKNPKLSSEWHPTKNKDLTPNNVTVGSGKKVWWLGKCGHEWEAIISNRIKNSGCPICANQKVLSHHHRQRQAHHPHAPDRPSRQ